MEKQFTWRELKRIVNKMPDNRLDDGVSLWDMEKDSEGKVATGVEILKEDYHDDGDVGTWPKSIMKENAPKEEWGDYPLVFPKGTRIIQIQ